MEECGELFKRVPLDGIRRGELVSLIGSSDTSDDRNSSKPAGDVYTTLDLLHEWDVQEFRGMIWKNV